MTANASEHVETVKRIVERSQESSGELHVLITDLQKGFKAMSHDIQTALQNIKKTYLHLASEKAQEMNRAIQKQKEFNEVATQDCQAVNGQVEGLAKQTTLGDGRAGALQELLGSYN